MEYKSTKKIYIFSECVNCGPIMRQMLLSFFKYHPDEIIHIFGTYKDFKEVGKFQNVEYTELSDDTDLLECYKHGHLGTAHITAKVITQYSEGYDYICHIDADIIFRSECVSLFREPIEQGKDIIGPRRCYKNNAAELDSSLRRKDLGGLADVTQTYFFCFNKTKISDKFNFPTLRLMRAGFYNPLNHPTLDFFDSVEFFILNSGGTVFFLQPDDFGGLTIEGRRDNKYPDLNKDMDFGNKLIHFAGVGSGMSFYHNGLGQAVKSYADWAIKRYALYSWLVLGKKLSNFEYDDEINKKYELLKPYTT